MPCEITTVPMVDWLSSNRYGGVVITSHLWFYSQGINMGGF